MVSVEQGAHQLERVGQKLKGQSGAPLRKELLRGIRVTVKPIIPDIRASAGEHLPHQGGLDQRVAKSKLGVRTRLAGEKVGVQIRATEGHRQLKAMNEGRLRHPVYGNRGVWVQQSIEPGWFSDPIQDRGPRVRRDLLRVMDDIASKIERSV